VAEILYMRVPDGSTSKSFVDSNTPATLAHEFQHMINAGHKFTSSQSESFEDAWLDEGLSHIAEEAVGRAERGFTAMQELNYTAVRTPENEFLAFFWQNIARLDEYLSKPDKYAPTSATNDTSLAARGASWSFLRYAADHYSGNNPTSLTRQLSFGPNTGVPNFTQKTNAPFDNVVAGYNAALLADGFGISGLATIYTFRSWNIRDAISKSFGSYSLKVTTISPTGSFSNSSKSLPSSGNFYRVTAAGANPSRSIAVRNSSGQPLTSSVLRTIVIRIQ
jgi:hypothetical protein